MEGKEGKDLLCKSKRIYEDKNRKNNLYQIQRGKEDKGEIAANS